MRYWAIPGTEGATHRLGGLEKDANTGAISTDPFNHERMVRLRREKSPEYQPTYLSRKYAMNQPKPILCFLVGAEHTATYALRQPS